MLMGMFSCLWLAANVFAPQTTALMLYLIAFVTSTIYLISNRAKILSFIRVWPSSFAGSVVVFYICKIMAEKTINSSMGIEVDYLRHSSIVGGFLLWVPVSLMVVSAYLFLRSAYMRCLAPLVDNYRACAPTIKASDGEAEKTVQEFFPGLRSMFAAGILAAAAFLLFHADEGIRFSVMLDAMEYSDCGPAQSEVGYVRKNSNACYRFDTRLFNGSLMPTEVVSRKSG